MGKAKSQQASDWFEANLSLAPAHVHVIIKEVIKGFTPANVHVIIKEVIKGFTQRNNETAISTDDGVGQDHV